MRNKILKNGDVKLCAIFRLVRVSCFRGDEPPQAAWSILQPSLTLHSLCVSLTVFLLRTYHKNRVQNASKFLIFSKIIIVCSKLCSCKVSLDGWSSGSDKFLVFALVDWRKRFVTFPRKKCIGGAWHVERVLNLSDNFETLFYFSSREICCIPPRRMKEGHIN